MADVKIVPQKKVRLKVGVTYQGGVYPAGSSISVDEATAAKWIADEVAEALASEAPKPAPKENTDK